jgi:glutamate-1-semialdehyde 2,1-aminomutase
MRTTKKSTALFTRSLEYLTGGSSTASKRVTYDGDEPAVIVRGKGCRVWDADGNEYIDFRNSLGPVTLGYAVDEVNDAIKNQLENGIVFGHPHPLEGEVAEILCGIIPCAEQARFLKTGGEACAAVIRIARAATGRDKILQIGYNGWLNAVGAGASVNPRETSSGVPLGVPKAVSDLFYVGHWGHEEEIEKIFAFDGPNIAAVIVAAGYPEMRQGETFLPFIRKITEKYGALMIADEIVTGFRLALGGAQEYFKTTPDLAVFAKGMANGMPISTYLGKKEYMQFLDKAIVSSTYGGETLSLAAAKAVINLYQRENVVEHLWRMGEKMWDGAAMLARQYGVPIEFKGFAPCKAVMPAEPKLGEAFFRAAYRNGLSFYTVNYTNYSHKAADIDDALERLEKALRTM